MASEASVSVTRGGAFVSDASQALALQQGAEYAFGSRSRIQPKNTAASYKYKRKQWQVRPPQHPFTFRKREDAIRTPSGSRTSLSTYCSVG